MAKLVSVDNIQTKKSVVIDINRRINKYKYRLYTSVILNVILLTIMLYLKLYGHIK